MQPVTEEDEIFICFLNVNKLHHLTHRDLLHMQQITCNKLHGFFIVPWVHKNPFQVSVSCIPKLRS